MVSLRKINPVARAIVVIGAVMALVTSVTFAALQSQATLTNNTISTASAGLLLWDGDSFESTAPGFAVTGLIPGKWSENHNFYLHNSGEGPLFLTASVPEEPALPEGMDSYGFEGWENLKVMFTGYCGESGGEPSAATKKHWWDSDGMKHVVKTNMAELLAGEVSLPCGPLAEGAMGDSNTPGTAGNYSVSFKINDSAITGESAGVGSFNIVLGGSLTSNQ